MISTDRLAASASIVVCTRSVAGAKATAGETRSATLSFAPTPAAVRMMRIVSLAPTFMFCPRVRCQCKRWTMGSWKSEAGGRRLPGLAEQPRFAVPFLMALHRTAVALACLLAFAACSTAAQPIRQQTADDVVGTV